MRAHFYNVPLPIKSRLNVEYQQKNSFGQYLHFHPELELHHVIEGQGIHFIGNHIGTFSDGEMVLIGKNLPHRWVLKESKKSRRGFSNIKAFVIHFRYNFLGEDFLTLPDARKIRETIDRSKNGLLILGNTKRKISNLLDEYIKKGRTNKLSLMLNILTLISDSKNIKDLNHNYKYNIESFQKERIEKVISYTQKNYSSHITLSEIASITNYSTTSFCRFFKSIMNKTYQQYLSEVRIKESCKIILNTNETNEVIAYKCGFSNLTSFYKKFKELIGETPNTFRKNIIEKHCF